MVEDGELRRISKGELKKKWPICSRYAIRDVAPLRLLHVVCWLYERNAGHFKVVGLESTQARFDTNLPAVQT